MADLVAAIRRRGERAAERLWVRWYRFSGRWRGRWRRFRGRWGERWERTAEDCWVIWYRAGSWLGRRREVLLRHPRSHTHRRAPQYGRAAALPALAVAAAGVYVALIVTMATKSVDAYATANRSRIVDPNGSSAAPNGIDIPDLRGMSASEARDWLEDAGLTFAAAEPMIGPPGKVLRTDPAAGQIVPARTPVTVVIGVEPERIAEG